jgi:hypothetical protein
MSDGELTRLEVLRDSGLGRPGSERYFSAPGIIRTLVETSQHRMSRGSTASLRAGHRLAQNFCNIWMMGRRSSLLRRLVMQVSQREIGPFGNE